MAWHGFSTTSDVIGIGAERVRSFSELEGDYTVKALVEAGKCDGCGACFAAFRDAGFQAIWMDEKTAVVSADDCTGCSLCAQICPADAIFMVEV